MELNASLARNRIICQAFVLPNSNKFNLNPAPARFFVAYKKYLYLNQPPCHQHTNATSFDTHGSTKREWYLNKIKAQSQ